MLFKAHERVFCAAAVARSVLGWMVSLSVQASALWLAICIFNPLMGGSTPSLQHVSMSSPKVAAQGSSQSPSRTPPVELWVYIFNCIIKKTIFPPHAEISCNPKPSQTNGKVLLTAENSLTSVQKNAELAWPCFQNDKIQLAIVRYIIENDYEELSAFVDSSDPFGQKW